MPPHPSSEKDEPTPIQQTKAAVPDREYRVGPGCPPKEHQFKKGQSGNPKGAKRKGPSLVPDIKKLLEQALDRKIVLSQGQEKRTLTLFAAGIEQLVKQYVTGDRHARKELFSLAKEVGLDHFGRYNDAATILRESSKEPVRHEDELTLEELDSLTDQQLKTLSGAGNIVLEVQSRRGSKVLSSESDSKTEH